MVDDEAVFPSLVVFHLEAAGYRVFEARSGNDAFSMLADLCIDAVVSDIEMPRGNGIELLVKIKQAMPNLPVVLMSGNPSACQDACDVGLAERVFEKPFNPPELVETLARSLESLRNASR